MATSYLPNNPYANMYALFGVLPQSSMPPLMVIAKFVEYGLCKGPIDAN